MSDETVPAYDVCRAWIHNNKISGEERRACVLLSGHYKEEITVGGSGRSWHTDCPDAIGKDRPVIDRPTGDLHDHQGPLCSVWADRSDGAHPDNRIAPGGRGSRVSTDHCVRCPHTPDQHVGHQGCSMCACELSKFESTDEGWATHPDRGDEVITPAAPKTQKINYLGDYEAQVRVGGASSTVRGPARLVAAVIRAFSDAFEEESER